MGPDQSFERNYAPQAASFRSVDLAVFSRETRGNFEVRGRSPPTHYGPYLPRSKTPEGPNIGFEISSLKLLCAHQ